MAFLIGLCSVLGYQYLRTKQVQSPPVVSPEVVQPTPEPTFALEPPSQALTGTLTVTSGHAQKYSRNDTQYREASSGAQILIGESVATKDNSTAVTDVNGVVKATLGSTAELIFANLFPANTVLQQKNGKIDYVVTQPISVRALDVLINLNPGETVVNIIDTDMSITVKTGPVKFALVDNDNNTNVYTLTKGQRANIDDAADQVYLIQP